jgi:hypothetical protein
MSKKKKKHQMTSPPEAMRSDAPALDTVAPSANAAVFLGLAGILATCVWPLALALDAAAIFIGHRFARNPVAPENTRRRAGLGRALGIAGFAFAALLGGLVLLNHIDFISKKDPAHRLGAPQVQTAPPPGRLDRGLLLPDNAPVNPSKQ